MIKKKESTRNICAFCPSASVILAVLILVSAHIFITLLGSAATICRLVQETSCEADNRLMIICMSSEFIYNSLSCTSRGERNWTDEANRPCCNTPPCIHSGCNCRTSACGIHGTAVRSGDEWRCDCTSGYVGEFCNIKTKTNGTCIENYFGVDCKQWCERGDLSLAAECGTYGVACQSCSGHGYCGDNGQCICNSNWVSTGLFNSGNRLCNLGCDTGSNGVVCGNGNCIQGTCKCHEGSYAKTVDSVCLYCPTGFYRKKGDSNFQCNSCPSGFFTSNTTILQSDKCRECEKGTYSTQIESGNCVACPDLFYSSRKSMSVCLDCPSAFKSLQNQSGCEKTPCSHGKYVFGDTCRDCAIGQISKRLKVFQCTNCTAGRYQDETASSICKDCPTDFYSTKECVSICKSCPTNQTAVPWGGNATYCVKSIQCETGQGEVPRPPRMPTCRDCIAGANVQNKSCTLCTVGQYTNQSRQTTCIVCPAGDGFESLTNTNLQRGQYTTTAGSTECKSCPEGFSARANATDNDKCTMEFEVLHSTSITRGNCGSGYRIINKTECERASHRFTTLPVPVFEFEGFFCSSRFFPSEGLYGARLPVEHPFYDADAATECMNRCVAAASPNDATHVWLNPPPTLTCGCCHAGSAYSPSPGYSVYAIPSTVHEVYREDRPPGCYQYSSFPSALKRIFWNAHATGAEYSKRANGTDSPEAIKTRHICRNAFGQIPYKTEPFFPFKELSSASIDIDNCGGTHHRVYDSARCKQAATEFGSHVQWGGAQSKANRPPGCWMCKACKKVFWNNNKTGREWSDDITGNVNGAHICEKNFKLADSTSIADAACGDNFEKITNAAACTVAASQTDSVEWAERLFSEKRPPGCYVCMRSMKVFWNTHYYGDEHDASGKAIHLCKHVNYIYPTSAPTKYPTTSPTSSS